MEGHPYDFHVSGPRNLSSPNWRDLFQSSWKDPNYKRMVIACFIQVAYLLELDRQEKKTWDNGLAPKWWKPFKYKLAQTLVDERDGSIYGVVLEWDRSSALSDLVLIRPSGAPKAVLALRGTLLNKPTRRRDVEDDLRFLAWETLAGSVRFKGALQALRNMAERYGSNKVCIGGHSLGAGFALQVGKALAKEGMFVECHLFNPPSVSLGRSLKTVREKAGSVLRRFRAISPSNSEVELDTKGSESSGNREDQAATEVERWVPYLYVNDNDYVCCYYNRTGVATEITPAKETENDRNGITAAKFFVVSKGPQKFLQAHGLQQWWSDDVELQLALEDSKLLHRQLRSLYAITPPVLL
ncbi:GDSL esterase/lipase At4g10955-like [Typha latifolia]|uniref:GDSL esterase/lipase At4g10955-like n=1 Tax=Typha latifolia TaxID=4733 RepID=UPI003C2F55C0